MDTRLRSAFHSVGLATSLAFALAVASPADGQLRSWAPAQGYPHTVDAWAHVTYSISVSCSPPRACYAKSQWLRAYVHCYSRSVAMLEVVSLDLNGDVVNTWTADHVWFERSWMRDDARMMLGLVCGTVASDF